MFWEVFFFGSLHAQGFFGECKSKINKYYLMVHGPNRLSNVLLCRKTVPCGAPLCGLCSWRGNRDSFFLVVLSQYVVPGNTQYQNYC